jgi:hypothetical protein
LTGRERFRLALEGRDVAFAPLVWERLAELVHHAAPDWWRDPVVGQRLLTDTAGLACADALFVVAAADAAASVAAAGARGDDALDELARSPDAQSGYELVATVRESRPFAIIAALPDAAWLQARFGAPEPEAAEDALSDLARGYLDAGADALAIIGGEDAAVRRAADRAGSTGDYYGRPVLAICRSADAVEAWLHTGGRCSVATISDAGEWPDLSAGLVLTAGDVGPTWDAARLHAVGSGAR